MCELAYEGKRGDQCEEAGSSEDGFTFGMAGEESAPALSGAVHKNNKKNLMI